MTTTFVNGRDLMRSYTEVIKRLQETRQPVLITSHNEPQAALISLSDFEELAALRRREAAEELKTLSAEIARDNEGKDVPTDVSTNHNQYFYEAYEEMHKSTL